MTAGGSSSQEMFITLDNGFKYVIPDPVKEKFELANQCNLLSITIKKRMVTKQQGSKSGTPSMSAQPVAASSPIVEDLFLPCNQYRSNTCNEYNVNLISTDNTRNPPDCQRLASEKSMRSTRNITR